MFSTEIIQPLIGAIQAWLAVWYNLPFFVRALCGVSVYLLFLSKVIIIIYGRHGDG